MNDPLRKDDYRAVTLLPHVSKIFERFICKQINSYMCDKLSKQVLEMSWNATFDTSCVGKT